jgi:hypothetical protein
MKVKIKYIAGFPPRECEDVFEGEAILIHCDAAGIRLEGFNLRKTSKESRPRWFDGWRRFIPLLALVSVLTGCLDYIPPPEAITGEPNYYTCGIYQPPLADTMDYTVQDSTRACPDGSMPQLFEATWLDTDYDCPAIWGYVVDGSIRRRFACYTGTVDTAWPLTHKL